MSVFWAGFILVCSCSYSLSIDFSGYGARLVTFSNGTKAMARPVPTRGRDQFYWKDGYVLHPNDTTMRIPFCKSGCRNGYCEEPDECSCDDNYMPNLGKCEETCESGTGICGHGKCVNGICKCQRGYKRASDGEYCEPVCDDCNEDTQICSAPHKCTCQKGYKQGTFACEPICRRDCLHGECILPDFCMCDGNSIKQDGICQSFCWMDCNYGICVDRNVCECFPGFSLGLPSLKCIPNCDNCRNGKCIGPNHCLCNEGYEWSEGEKRCAPQCDDCSGVGTVCVAPNVCKCRQKYKQTLTHPRVICSKVCKRGLCLF